MFYELSSYVLNFSHFSVTLLITSRTTSHSTYRSFSQINLVILSFSQILTVFFYLFILCISLVPHIFSHFLSSENAFAVYGCRHISGIRSASVRRPYTADTVTWRVARPRTTTTTRTRRKKNEVVKCHVVWFQINYSRRGTFVRRILLLLATIKASFTF